MMSSGNEGALVVGDEIDWIIECIGEGDMMGDVKYDIQEFLESIDFTDSMCLDLESLEAGATCDDLPFVTSVGQPTCERKDKTSVKAVSSEFPAGIVRSQVRFKGLPNKKRKTLVCGPSNRTCKKKIKGLPKRPLSAYNLFFQSERLKIFEEGVLNHERISFQGLAKLVGQRWQVLDEEKRQELRRRSQEDIIRYQNEMKEYRQKHGNDPSLVMPRKKSPPNSPKSIKSMMGSPGSPQQKCRNSAASRNQDNELGPTKSDSVSLPDQKNTVDDIGPVMSNSVSLSVEDQEVTIEEGLTGNIGIASSKRCFRSIEKLPLSCRAKDRIDNSNDSGGQYKLGRLPQPLMPATPTPPLLNHVQFQPVCGDIAEMHRVVRLYPQSPARGFHYPKVSQQEMHYAHCTTTPYPCKKLPIGKEKELYDPYLGITRSYKIDYKCYVMRRSEADAYIASYSYPGINGSHYVPLKQMLHAQQPPGVEVRMPMNKSC